MKTYWPLVIFLPLIACAGAKPIPEAPKSRAPLNIQSPPPADGIMFVPVRKDRGITDCCEERGK